MSFFFSSLLTYVAAALAMAFYTLLERKLLGYIQTRKGPNKVGLAGLPQPFADALKLFSKELTMPTFANTIPFTIAPCMALFLALTLWILYPHMNSSYFFSFGILFFLTMSSLNVYTTLAAGWSSNSKYSLLGALRGVAQTISYEVSMILILLSPLILFMSLNITTISLSSLTPTIFLLFPVIVIWFITCLAETARAPFDFAEGESELVSGFNTEYSGGTFALIFMAEYMNILFLSLLTSALFLNFPTVSFLYHPFLLIKTLVLCILFVWVRASYPRMRYDKLMMLTWKSFLPLSLSIMVLCTTTMYFL